MASAMRQLHRTHRHRNLLTTPLPGLRYRSGAPAGRESYSISLLNCDTPRRASTRRYSSSRISQLCSGEIASQMHHLWASVATRVFAVLSYFPGSENQEIPHSARRGTGFFVSPTLIVTSARVVGRVSTVFDSDRNSVLHNCFIAKTIVYNGDGITQEVFCTRPVAVNFAADVAVLEVQNPMRWPPLAVAKSVADMDHILIGVARHGNCHGATGIIPIYPWPREKACRRPKAPWPLDDKVEWADYGATETKDDMNVWLSDICGTPWFNLQREVVGMASWAAEKADGNIHSYAVPPSCIKLMVDYANTKGPHDPIVVDRWINACTVPDYNSDINEECIPRWTTNILMKVHKFW